MRLSIQQVSLAIIVSASWPCNAIAQGADTTQYTFLFSDRPAGFLKMWKDGRETISEFEYNDRGRGPHVVERYTPRSADTLNYEATIEDPKTFSRPWKISMPLYRRVEKNARLLEYKCVEFAEELLYGPLSKKP